MISLLRALALSLAVAGTADAADLFKHATTSPAAPQPSSPSGALDFQTDTFTGRFQYRFPIRIAPARNGSEPEINLVYNSGSGNGFCGVGWTLDLGTIQRETRYGVPFLWQNGVATSYDDSKGFVSSFQGVNGRLVSIGNGGYRAASDREFFTFTAGEADGWVVYDKSGTKFTFLPGLINPRVQPTVDLFDATFLWNLERVETADGNLTLIEYTDHLGQRYPQKIWYNGHTNSFPCTHSVEFVWENRARDTNISYASGFRVTTSNRLKEIIVKVGQSQVRKYILGYTNSPCTLRSLLTRIDEQGSDATATTPPVTFEYQDKGLGFDDPAPWPNLNGQTEGYDLLTAPDANLPPKNYGWITKLLDIDGDALPDAIARTPESDSHRNRFVVRPSRTGGMTNFGGLHSQLLGWGPIYDTPPSETAPRSPIFIHWDGSDGYVTTIIDLLDINGDGYLYDDDGERVRKLTLAGETVWIDDIYEREPGRTLCHVQAGDKRIVTFSADGSEFYYYHSDHLGSSSLMTDQDGSLVRQQYGYRAFGSERFALSFSPSFTSRFTGQSFDADTGLYYYQSRYYDPELGRFIQPDSIVPNPGSSQSLNRYSYVLNNPLKYIDPTGHAEQPTSFFGGSGTLGFGSGRNWIGAGWGASGFLGAGFGRDWLGLGYQARKLRDNGELLQHDGPLRAVGRADGQPRQSQRIRRRVVSRQMEGPACKSI